MKSRFPVACLLVSFSGLASLPVQAEEPSPVSGSLDLTSDYRFRGLTQTNGDPALQGGVEYANAGGFYTGAWGSNISWLSDGQEDVSSSVELDVYAGFRGSWGDAVNYDIGLQYYAYPGSFPSGFNDADTWEGYASLGWSILTLKYSYAFTDLFGISDSEGSGYLDLGLSQGFAEKWTVDAHVGRQWVDGDNALSYTDWSLGLSYDIGHGFGVSVAYVDTNARQDLYTNAFGKYVGDATGVLTLSKAF